MSPTLPDEITSTLNQLKTLIEQLGTNDEEMLVNYQPCNHQAWISEIELADEPFRCPTCDERWETIASVDEENSE